MLEEFENEALFLWLGLPSTLIQRNCPTKRELLKDVLENRGIWKWRALCVLVWTENILKTKLFLNDDVMIIRCFVCLSLPQWRPKLWLPCWFRHLGSTKTLLCTCSRVHSSVSAACGCCVFTFLRRSVDGKHFIRFLVWMKSILMRFQSETSIFKFLQRSVDRA